MLDDDQLDRIIRAVTRTDPTPELLNRLRGFEDEDEAIALLVEEEGGPAARVTVFYQIFFNRLPEAEGLDFWTGRVRDEPDLDDAALAGAFYDAGEFEALYGGLETETAVAEIYRNVLGRNPDAAGLEYWTGRVTDDPDFGLEQLGLAFALSGEVRATLNPLADSFLTALARGDTITEEDLFDFDDVPDAPPSDVLVVEGEPVTEVLEPAGDADVFGFEAEGGRTYRISVTGEAGDGGTLADPLVTLFDADGLFLAADDNGAANGIDAELTRAVPFADTLFFISVEASDGGTGTYTLTVTDVTGGDDGGNRAGLGFDDGEGSDTPGRFLGPTPIGADTATADDGQADGGTSGGGIATGGGVFGVVVTDGGGVAEADDLVFFISGPGVDAGETDLF